MKVAIPKDISTEETIKQAARKLFSQKGYKAVTTREIAKEARIGHTLVNYYFRSKENLFKIVATEIRSKLIQTLSLIFNDANTSLKRKLELTIDFYYDLDLLNFPNMFFFITLESQPSENLDIQKILNTSVFIRQIREAIKKGQIAPIDPIDLLINIGGLILFPFVFRTRLQSFGFDNVQFKALVQGRKKMLLKWLYSMLTP